VRAALAAAFVLQLPYPVQSLSADGATVAVEPSGHSPQLVLHTPPLVVWSPATHRTRRVSTRGCAAPWGTSLVRGTIAFVCDNSCCDSTDQAVVLVRPSGAHSVVFRTSTTISAPHGQIVTGLGKTADGLVFTTVSVDARDRKTIRAYRIIGGRAARLASPPRVTRPTLTLVTGPHAVYVSRRRDGRRATFGVAGRVVAATVSSAGLFYATSRHGGRLVESYSGSPSHVVFVPMRELLARLRR
jgi:hypothetical protein